MPRLLKYFFFCVFCYCFQKSFAQHNDEETVAYKHITESFKTHIFAIAHDSMGGRYAGSVYELKAHDYLTEYLNTFIDERYVQQTDSFVYCCRDGDSVTAHNIWVWPIDTTKDIVVFAAHYDHLPPNSNHSKEIWHKDKVHPGADDNASGVALAVELFKYFIGNEDSINFNVALILFSGHEEGLHGSGQWVQQHTLKRAQIQLLMNFDMVGRMSEESSIVSLRLDKGNIYIDNLNRAAQPSNMRLIYNSDSFRDTDSFNFYGFGVQAFTVSTGIHNDYHRITDTADKINFKGMDDIFNFMARFIKGL